MGVRACVRLFVCVYVHVCVFNFFVCLRFFRNFTLTTADCCCHYRCCCYCYCCVSVVLIVSLLTFTPHSVYVASTFPSSIFSTNKPPSRRLNALKCFSFLRFLFRLLLL